MTVRKRATDRCAREKVRSPGRPSAWQRGERGRFWQAIALGRSSEEAALDAGVSAPLGPRWFREAGGMPPTHMALWAKPRTGRYLSFSKREDIAIELVKGSGFRTIARKLGRSASTISREVRRNAATRSGRMDNRPRTAQWHADRAARRPRLGNHLDRWLLFVFMQFRFDAMLWILCSRVYDLTIARTKTKRYVQIDMQRRNATYVNLL